MSAKPPIAGRAAPTATGLSAQPRLARSLYFPTGPQLQAFAAFRIRPPSATGSEALGTRPGASENSGRSPAGRLHHPRSRPDTDALYALRHRSAHQSRRSRGGMDLDRLLAPAPDVLEPLSLKQQRMERHLGVTNETTKSYSRKRVAIVYRSMSGRKKLSAPAVP